ncbi:MAG TPA: DUF2314 domain-containing protein [Gemmatimonadaceae bacterium]|nr:DUF2314 domain-containing protein [Gemmatimonadaceae bacterium]
MPRTLLRHVARLAASIVLLPLLLLLRLAGRVVGGSGVVDFAADDAGMNEAIAHARSTVGGFVARLDDPAGIDRQAVKVPLPVVGGGSEHVWLADVRLEDGLLVGTIGNAPERALGFREGELLRTKPEQISDWSYVEDGRLVGGFTVRHLRNCLSPRERRKLDAALPFTIEEEESGLTG